MKLLLYHPFGNQNVRGVLKSLEVNGLLHSFHTTIAFFKGNLLYNVKFFSWLKKREYDYSIKKKTVTYPFWELIRQLGIFKKITGGYVNLKLTPCVANYLKRNINDIDGAYCYGHGALEIFQELKKHNKKCYYDLPIAYYKEIENIVNDERIENPEWASLLSIYRNKSTLHIIDEELALADAIIVASTYSQRCLLKYGLDSSKIKIIPYGFPDVNPKEYNHNSNRRIILLYVGGLHQLKGLSYMFEAINKMADKVELRIIGGGNTSFPLLKQQLEKHTYLGTMSHDKVLEQMRLADVLLFPTLSDGFGMVVTEAMSQGTPVVATENSCGPDIIIDGKNGWLVKARSSNALVEKLSSIISCPEIIEIVGKNALETAKTRPWDKYYEDVCNFLICHQ